MICAAYRWTGFYMIRTYVMRELNISHTDTERKKPFGVLLFSGGIEMKHWEQMG